MDWLFTFIMRNKMANNKAASKPYHGIFLYENFNFVSLFIGGVRSDGF